MLYVLSLFNPWGVLPVFFCACVSASFRVQALEPLVDVLSKKAYSHLHKELSFELGEIYQDLADLKVTRYAALIVLLLLVIYPRLVFSCVMFMFRSGTTDNIAEFVLNRVIC